MLSHGTKHRQKGTLPEDWWIGPDNVAQDSCTLVVGVSVVQAECITVGPDVVAEVRIADVASVWYVVHR